MMGIIRYLSRPLGCITPRVNPKMNYEFWVIIMCQYRFIFGNKYTIPASDDDREKNI